MCQNSLPSGGDGSIRAKISGGKGRPTANILIPLEKQQIALQPCRWQFLYNETLQQTFRPVLSKLSKRRQISVLYPNFEEVRGSVKVWLMARWKARVEFLLSVIELLFLSLTVEVPQGKMCQNLLPSGGGRSLGAKISGERVFPFPLPIYWYHSKGIWLRYNLAADSLYIMKLCSRPFVLYCWNCTKDDKFRYFIPILKQLGAAQNLDGSLESPCEVLVKCNWTSFSISYSWGDTRQNVSKLAAFRRG